MFIDCIILYVRFILAVIGVINDNNNNNNNNNNRRLFSMILLIIQENARQVQRETADRSLQVVTKILRNFRKFPALLKLWKSTTLKKSCNKFPLNGQSFTSL